MDLIGQLTQQLGVNPQQAQRLAGSVLGLVQSTVKEKLGDDAAGQVAQAVPELQGWQQAAAPQAAPAGEGGGLMGALGGLMGGGSGLGGLGGALGALGGAASQAGEVAALVSIAQRFTIDASKATLIAPIVLNFLKSRLDPSLVSKILAVAPMLAGAGGGGSGPSGGGGLGGALGGLLG
ncbi:DUF2780 domain-containing protein [Hyalangium versicolor]|uniref:DUF2780 domain-containing protein n=1 Tax=Hyalangium versicolor TaxID=2861190 RepID=UPI001CCC683C|nr:DUF2780 domain-containing protein [Hyalangium versicolor]